MYWGLVFSLLYLQHYETLKSKVKVKIISMGTSHKSVFVVGRWDGAGAGAIVTVLLLRMIDQSCKMVFKECLQFNPIVS